MSKLSTKAFASAVGIRIGTVKVHINRKKLERDPEGYIDTETPKNKSYIDKMTGGKGLYQVPQVEVSKDADGNKQQILKFVDNRSPEERKRANTIDDIDLRKKKADLDSAEQGAELKRLMVEKQAGHLLPVELVERIYTINIQAIFRTFEGESENVASIFSEVMGGTRAHLSEIIKRMRGSLKDAIAKAETDGSAEIAQAIKDYKVTRSRGERKL